MDWIDEQRREIKRRWKISPIIKENFDFKFESWRHRIQISLLLDDAGAPPVLTNHTRYDSPSASIFGHKISYIQNKSSEYYLPRLKLSLIKKLYDGKFEHAWRDNRLSAFLYTNDIETTLKKLKPEHRARITHINIMRDDTADIYLKKEPTDYKTVTRVKKRLPYGRFHYKVYVSTMVKTRKSIGKSGLDAIDSQLKNYESTMLFSKKFKSGAKNYRVYQDSYFYAENLDWLPIIILIDPRYVKTIEHFVTSEEYQNGTDSNAVEPQPNH